MTTAPYLLQARALAGPLYALTRNDTHSEDSDDWAALVDRAQTLTGEGFTVWLFVDAALGPARMRCTAIHTPTPTGQRVHSPRHPRQQRRRHRQRHEPNPPAARRRAGSGAAPARPAWRRRSAS